MKAVVDLQLAIDNSQCPEQKQCEKILQRVLNSLEISDSKECTIRVVDTNESAQLNQQYRNIEGATNVLSFPFENTFNIEQDIALDLLGDLVICAPLVIEEAKHQDKTPLAHYTHIIIHGLLHLLGYDHIDDDEATIMESIECRVLESFGVSDPYQ